MSIILECLYDPPHEHEFPDDWDFGGADGLSPMCDPRWRTIRNTYVYFDDKLRVVGFTQAFLCDEEAIDKFTQIASHGPQINPVWVQATRPDGRVETLKVRYNKETDEVWDT